MYANGMAFFAGGGGYQQPQARASGQRPPVVTPPRQKDASSRPYGSPDPFGTPERRGSSPQESIASCRRSPATTIQRELRRDSARSRLFVAPAASGVDLTEVSEELAQDLETRLTEARKELAEAKERADEFMRTSSAPRTTTRLQSPGSKLATLLVRPPPRPAPRDPANLGWLRSPHSPRRNGLALQEQEQAALATHSYNLWALASIQEVLLQRVSSRSQLLVARSQELRLTVGADRTTSLHLPSVRRRTMSCERSLSSSPSRRYALPRMLRSCCLLLQTNISRSSGVA